MAGAARCAATVAVAAGRGAVAAFAGIRAAGAPPVLAGGAGGPTIVNPHLHRSRLPAYSGFHGTDLPHPPHVIFGIAPAIMHPIERKVGR